MPDLWAFLGDPQNQATLSWLGGGLVVLAGGTWAVVKFFAGRESGNDKAAPPPVRIMVRADQGGIVGGRDVSMQTNQGVSGLQAVFLVAVVVGGVLLAGGLLGAWITAQNCGIATGGDIRGSTITAACPTPAGK
jgi:hypothetical protein